MSGEDKTEPEALAPPYVASDKTLFEGSQAKKEKQESAVDKQSPDVEGKQEPKEAPALPSAWLSKTKSKREIPKAAKIAGGGAFLLVCLVFLMPNACGSSSTTTTTTSSSTGDSGNMATAESLKKRRYLTAENFRGPASSSRAPSPVASESSLSIEERQRLREDNPEEVRRVRRSSSVQVRPRALAQPRQEKQEPDMIVFFNQDTAEAGQAGRSERRKKAQRLLPAASSVNISLSSDVVIRSGRTTVVATVDPGQKLAAGTKLIGSASADRDGLVSLHFRTVVLTTGQSISTRADAMDDLGSTSIIGTVVGGRKEAEKRSVASTVGRGAAEQATLGVLGGGLLGGAARDTFSETRRPRQSYGTTTTVVTLSRETPLKALFLRELSVK